MNITSYYINKSLIASRKKKKVLIFDAHGVIFETTWLKELTEIYIQLTGKSDTKEIEDWLILNQYLKNYNERINYLHQITKININKIDKIFKTIQKEMHDNMQPVLKHGIIEFLETINQENKEVYVISGSTKQLILKQLSQTETLKYFDKNNIFGLDTVFAKKNSIKNDVINSIINKTKPLLPVLFDDWITGIKEIKKNNGIIIGFPQGQGQIFQLNKKKMKAEKVDIILKDWKPLIRIAKRFF